MPSSISCRAAATSSRCRHERFSFSRWLGILIKEFIQLRRDRLTFGMIVMMPIMQLLLFGFAINSDPGTCPPRW